MSPNSDLTHFDPEGNARMVDVGAKPVSERQAVAQAIVRMEPATGQAIQQRQTRKGDVVQVARLAGIMAAKRTDLLIPLCHSLSLSSVEIDFTFVDDRALRIVATVKTSAQTGVEMEALVAASTAALTVYDMCKAIDRGMSIHDLYLLAKVGGKSGVWRRGD